MVKVTPQQIALMQDLLVLGGCSVFSPWEYQMLKRLKDNGLVIKRSDGAYELTGSGIGHLPLNRDKRRAAK